MNDILDNSNAPNFIDYLSIDTEGSEYDILKTVIFDKYIFGFINIEHNYEEPIRTNIKELLAHYSLLLQSALLSIWWPNQMLKSLQ